MPQIVHNLLCDPLFLPESALPHSSKSGPLLFCKQGQSTNHCGLGGHLCYTVLHDPCHRASHYSYGVIFLYHSKNNPSKNNPSHRADHALQPQSDLSQGTETHSITEKIQTKATKYRKTENERAYLPFSWSEASVEK